MFLNTFSTTPVCRSFMQAQMMYGEDLNLGTSKFISSCLSIHHDAIGMKTYQRPFNFNWISHNKDKSMIEIYKSGRRPAPPTLTRLQRTCECDGRLHIWRSIAECRRKILFRYLFTTNIAGLSTSHDVLVYQKEP